MMIIILSVGSSLVSQSNTSLNRKIPLSKLGRDTSDAYDQKRDLEISLNTSELN